MAEVLICLGFAGIITAAVVFCFLIGWHMKNVNKYSGKKGFNHE